MNGIAVDFAAKRKRVDAALRKGSPGDKAVTVLEAITSDRDAAQFAFATTVSTEPSGIQNSEGNPALYYYRELRNTLVVFFSAFAEMDMTVTVDTLKRVITDADSIEALIEKLESGPTRDALKTWADRFRRVSDPSDALSYGSQLDTQQIRASLGVYWPRLDQLSRGESAVFEQPDSSAGGTKPTRWSGAFDKNTAEGRKRRKFLVAILFVLAAVIVHRSWSNRAAPADESTSMRGDHTAFVAVGGSNGGDVA